MIERKEYLDKLKKWKDKDLIKVVTGIRRCGKSTLFELYIDYLKDSGIDDKHIISINLENPDNEFRDYKELRIALGDARTHGLFADFLNEIGTSQKAVYELENTAIIMAITLVTAENKSLPNGDVQNPVLPYPLPNSSFAPVLDPEALGCFFTYISGTGGEDKAWEEGFTRKNIPAELWILKGTVGTNSAKNHLEKNLRKAMMALEGVLNRYNTEIYLSVSPDKKMDGCLYGELNEKIDLSTIASITGNIAVFGTFNDADVESACTVSIIRKRRNTPWF